MVLNLDEIDSVDEEPGGSCKNMKTIEEDTEDSDVFEGACESNKGRIGDMSCVGEESCTSNTGFIAAQSCNGDLACKENSAIIAPLSW